MNKLKHLIATYWIVYVGLAIGFTAIFSLLFWRLASLTPGLSQIEILTIQNSQSLEAILLNPISLPFLIPMWLLQKIGLDGIISLRSVGAVFGALSIVLMFIMLRQWQTTRIAILGSILFASSSWFLHTSRLAAPYIAFVVAILFLAVCLFWIHYSKYRKITAAIAALGLAISLYIPGFIWFVLAVFIWRRTDIVKIAKKIPWWFNVILILFTLTLLAPLGYATALDYTIALNFLAIPVSFEPLDWLRQLAIIPAYILARGPENAALNLGRLPLIDLFTTGLLIIGGYSYYLRSGLLRTQFLIICSAITVLLVALNGPIFFALLLPIIYIVATAGLTLLLQQWFTVFPSNPIARGLGIIIIVIALGMTSFYHVNRYFVAWSGNPQTKNTFTHQISEEL